MPAPVVIKISIPNAEAIEGKIAEIVARAKDVSGLLASIGQAEKHVVLDRFASKTAPDGSAWAENRPLTLMLAGGRGSMMRRSGNLMGSIDAQVGGSTLRIGPNTKYAAVQQFGATIGSPAHAGMVPLQTLAALRLGGLPRTRGNGPGP